MYNKHFENVAVQCHIQVKLTSSHTWTVAQWCSVWRWSKAGGSKRYW